MLPSGMYSTSSTPSKEISFKVPRSSSAGYSVPMMAPFLFASESMIVTVPVVWIRGVCALITWPLRSKVKVPPKSKPAVISRSASSLTVLPLFLAAVENALLKVSVSAITLSSFVTVATMVASLAPAASPKTGSSARSVHSTSKQITILLFIGLSPNFFLIITLKHGRKL